MSFVKEFISRKTYDRPFEEVFDHLLKVLSESGFEVIKTNRTKGEIVFRCLIDLLNMRFWRSWGDKVLLKCSAIDKEHTDLQIYGIPNLFRLGVRNNEKVFSKDALVKLIYEQLS